MAKPISEQARTQELAQLAKRLSDAELQASTIRGQLDARLFYHHENGATIAGLARATGLSRQAVYNSIGRYRARLDS
jgi:hypothetical protein